MPFGNRKKKLLRIFVVQYCHNLQIITPLETQSSRGNILLEICTPDIRISAGYQTVIGGNINGYQEKIDQISIKYQTDFSKILKNGYI